MIQLEQITKDRELMKQVMRSESPRQAYELLAEHGLDCDYETFLKTMERVKDMYEKQQAGLLTEEDMDDLLGENQSGEMLGTAFFLFIAFGV